jgi:hypothetical protein
LYTWLGEWSYSFLGVAARIYGVERSRLAWRKSTGRLLGGGVELDSFARWWGDVVALTHFVGIVGRWFTFDG